MRCRRKWPSRAEQAAASTLPHGATNTAARANRMCPKDTARTASSYRGMNGPMVPSLADRRSTAVGVASRQCCPRRPRRRPCPRRPSRRRPSRRPCPRHPSRRRRRRPRRRCHRRPRRPRRRRRCHRRSRRPRRRRRCHRRCAATNARLRSTTCAKTVDPRPREWIATTEWTATTVVLARCARRRRRRRRCSARRPYPHRRTHPACRAPGRRRRRRRRRRRLWPCRQTRRPSASCASPPLQAFTLASCTATP